MVLTLTAVSDRVPVVPFAGNWAEVREAKEAYWAAGKAGMTPLEALQLADDLRAHVKSLRPEWPSAADRDADIELHSRVAEMLRRVRRR